MAECCISNDSAYLIEPNSHIGPNSICDNFTSFETFSNFLFAFGINESIIRNIWNISFVDMRGGKMNSLKLKVT